MNRFAVALLLAGHERHRLARLHSAGLIEWRGAADARAPSSDPCYLRRAACWKHRVGRDARERATANPDGNATPTTAPSTVVHV